MKQWLVYALVISCTLALACGCGQKEDSGGAPATAAKAPSAPAASAAAGGAGGGLASSSGLSASNEAAAPPAAEAAAPPASEAKLGGASDEQPEPGAEKQPEAKAEPGKDQPKDPAEAEAKEPAGEDEQAEPPADGDEVMAEDGAEAEAEPEAPANPIDQFKALDPREIIDRKYEDLQEQHTEPWNEEKPGEFIPDTGRVDPLTRVREAIPEELKPPRAGETDENDIVSYFVARDATVMAYTLAYGMECYNVIQIGIEKQATMSVFGNTFMMSEGESAGPINVGQSSGIPLSATLTCTSISESEVHVTVTVSGDGTTTSISKAMTFIPKSWI